jgi:serine/threonine protein kinase
MKIAHHTLKGNILIDDQRNARLCDFGISHMLTEEGTSGLTTVSEHTGTERYLSYELVVSEDAPTTASDVYALACIGLQVSREGFCGDFLLSKRPSVYLSTTSVC